MDEKLQVFIDKTKIAEYEKAIPAAHLFNAISFDVVATPGRTINILSAILKSPKIKPVSFHIGVRN